MNIHNVPWPGVYQGLRLSSNYEIHTWLNGKQVEFAFGHNLVTTTGENLVAKLLDPNISEDEPEYIAFGTGATGAEKTDTQLQSEIASTRAAADSSVQSSNTMQLTWEITAAGTYTVEEMGIFNASSAGTMMARFLTQTLDVVPGMVIDITWTITIQGID